MSSGRDASRAYAVDLDSTSAISPGLASLNDLYHVARAHRGGGDLFTRRVSDPLGSWAAAVAIRFDVHPTMVTLADLVLAVTASAVVITHAGQLDPGWLPGLAALLLWQLSFILDCADGQVARATGRASSFGARVDALVDLLVHAVVICALATVVTQQIELPAAVLIGAGLLWPLNIFINILAKKDGNIGHSFAPRGNAIVAVKLVRDTGFILLVIGAWLFVHPQSVVLPIAGVCAFNACFLLASIARESYLSMRRAEGSDRLSCEEVQS